MLTNCGPFFSLMLRKCDTVGRVHRLREARGLYFPGKPARAMFSFIDSSDCPMRLASLKYLPHRQKALTWTRFALDREALSIKS